jgi:hypothetical protein
MKTWLIVWNALCLPFVFWYFREAMIETSGSYGATVGSLILAAVSIFIVSVPGMLLFHGFNHLRHSLRNPQRQRQG